MRYEEALQFIDSGKWIFAKTMPQWPHYYVQRRDYSDDNDFNRFIFLIRENGFQIPWGKYYHTYLFIGQYKYWTMHWPYEGERVINRALIQPEYINADDFEQDFDIPDNIYEQGTALEIYCGKGHFLKKYPLIKSWAYAGIDHNPENIKCCNTLKCQESNLNYKVRQCYVEDFINKYYYNVTFDNVYSFNGSLSYVSPDAIKKIPKYYNGKGKFHLTFSKKTAESNKVSPYYWDKYLLKKHFQGPYKVEEHEHYFIVKA